MLGYPQSIITLAKSLVPNEYHEWFEIYVTTGKIHDDSDFRKFLDSQTGSFATNIVLICQLEILKIYIENMQKPKPWYVQYLEKIYSK